MQLPLRPFQGAYRSPGIPRIDPSNPLTVGLKVATIAQAGAQLNLITGALFPAVSSALGVNGDGAVRTFTGAGDTVGTPSMGTNGGAFSVVARIRPRNTVQSAKFAIYDCGSPAANGFDFYFDQAVTGGSLGLTVWGVAAFGSDASAGVIYSDSTGKPITVGVTYAKQNATGVRYFRSGVLSASQSAAGLGYNNISGTEYVGRREGTNEPFYGDIGFVYGWTRTLSDAEVAQVTSDPYCFLTFPEDDVFAMLVGRAAGTTFQPSWAIGSNVLISGGYAA